MADTPTYAELALMVTELVDRINTYVNQQVNIFTTQNLTAAITDGEGIVTVIPSWKAVQSAGSEAGGNAELAAASIYRKAVVNVAGAAYALPSSDVASWYDITINAAETTLTLPAPVIDSQMIKQITLHVIQGIGANVIKWPANVKWANGRPPVLAFNAGESDMVTLLFVGGNQWLGFFSAGGYAQ